MHVLLTESHFGDTERLAENLNEVGCRVSTCHGALGVCRVMAPGDRCPLDRYEQVDLVVDLRRGSDELSAREFGAVCAIRAGVPLMIVGVTADVRPVVPAGLQRWATAMTADQLVEHCRDRVRASRLAAAGRTAT